jgi:hypothetical protein
MMSDSLYSSELSIGGDGHSPAELSMTFQLTAAFLLAATVAVVPTAIITVIVTAVAPDQSAVSANPGALLDTKSFSV